MIPKVIHYCWFGRNPLPASAQKCIQSWKKFFPDYEIKEWNEDNFEVDSIPYTREAYQAKKYAFVSDYARFWILYHYGGLYFDTDVEVIRPMEDIIARGGFMGCEIDACESKGAVPAVAPGLGLGIEAHHILYQNILEAYQHFHFLNADGSLNQKTVVSYVTEILCQHGLQGVEGIQECEGIYIYPQDYFNPWDALLGKMNQTENTRTIHWYSKTWLPSENKFQQWGKRILRRCLGKDIGVKLKNLWKKLNQ